MNTNNLPQTDELAAYDPAQLFDHALIAYTLFDYTAIESHPGLVRHPVAGQRVVPPDYSNNNNDCRLAIVAFNERYSMNLNMHIFHRTSVVAFIVQYIQAHNAYNTQS